MQTLVIKLQTKFAKIRSRTNPLGLFKNLNTSKYLKNLKTSSGSLLNFTFSSKPSKFLKIENLTSN